ncbi:unnamed protein product [Arctogadus glacialis]
MRRCFYLSPYSALCVDVALGQPVGAGRFLGDRIPARAILDVPLRDEDYGEDHPGCALREEDYGEGHQVADEDLFVVAETEIRYVCSSIEL